MKFDKAITDKVTQKFIRKSNLDYLGFKFDGRT